MQKVVVLIGFLKLKMIKVIVTDAVGTWKSRKFRENGQ